MGRVAWLEVNVNEVERDGYESVVMEMRAWMQMS